MEELEELEYTGLAMAFSHENAGTSKTLKCFCPEFVEYVHAVILGGKVVNKSIIPMVTAYFFIHHKFPRFFYESPGDDPSLPDSKSVQLSSSDGGGKDGPPSHLQLGRGGRARATQLPPPSHLQLGRGG